MASTKVQTEKGAKVTTKVTSNSATVPEDASTLTLDVAANEKAGFTWGDGGIIVKLVQGGIAKTSGVNLNYHLSSVNDRLITQAMKKADIEKLLQAARKTKYSLTFEISKQTPPNKSSRAAAEASPQISTLDPKVEQTLTNACEVIKKVQSDGGGLLILTGAGMSVSSGVPVFRGADGTMSSDFLRFLANYNKARKDHGLEEADDWFSFSVPEMFRTETSKEAWHYWRWRILRAMVEPAEDYRHLSRLVNYFGEDKVFVKTSNCDQLHLKNGVNKDFLYECHGSLARLQCSKKCCGKFWPTDDAFVKKLAAEPDWVPMCPECNVACLRPNVMIFGDSALVGSEIQAQSDRMDAFTKDLHNNWVVLEVGAGVVISSIRSAAEMFATYGEGLVRVNPSASECAEFSSGYGERSLKEGENYWPLPLYSADAISRLCEILELPPYKS